MKYLIIAIAAGLLFMLFLGTVPLLDPPEARWAAAAQQLLTTGNYAPIRLGPAQVYDMPPLFLWLQAGSMALFGFTGFAARFPNAIIGILTLLTGYAISQKAGDEKLGAWWALVYTACWLPHLLFKSGTAEPLFNYCFFLAIYYAYRVSYVAKPVRLAVLSGSLLGLAMLTRGPVALVPALLLLLIYWIAIRGRTGVRAGLLSLFILCACLPTAIWLTYTGFMYDWTFARGYLSYQLNIYTIASHWYKGATFYYPILWAGSFPACIFLFNYLKGRKPSVYSTGQAPAVKDLRLWMWVFFWITLFTWPSSLCILPLSLLAAWQVYQLAEGRQHLLGWNVGLLLLAGIIIGIAFMLLPLAGVYKAALVPYARQDLIKAGLQANVSWSLWETVYGLGYIIWVIISGVLLLQRKYKMGLLLLFIGTLLSLQLTLLHFMPKVEAHVRAAISSLHYKPKANS